MGIGPDAAGTTARHPDELWHPARLIPTSGIGGQDEQEAPPADISEEAWATVNSTVSRPFQRLPTGKIAIKVISHHGDEVMKVLAV